MRITGPGRPIGPQGGASVRRASDGGASFAPASAETPARGAQTTSAGPLSSLDSLIALQTIEEDLPRQRRRRVVKRGHDILDVLDEIKIGLLAGQLSGVALDRVVALLGSLEPSGDPALDGLVEDIALRAEVELAKLGRYLERTRG
ncbi:flagellar assembly protein FliX [Chthonobacter albigriseus]|uniref:flagellar assembly protein FliX n=1 Tax=Chthonobacter albigriseus TaxID=1683161 RepID=UPI0015EE8F57|nr:flagellar assembly protein FliX [Chthonobacter albigriseus]